jgi:hypothetical protein
MTAWFNKKKGNTMVESLKVKFQPRETTEERLKAEIEAKATMDRRVKAEKEERKRIETQVKKDIAAAKTKPKKQFQSNLGSLTAANQKLIKTEEQVRTNAVIKAKHGPKAEIKLRQRFYEKPGEGLYTYGRTHRHIFHMGNTQRNFILLLILVTFSALTFALSVTNNPSDSEPGSEMTQEQSPASDAFVGSDTDGEQLNSDVAADRSLGSLSVPTPDMTNAPASNYVSEENVTFKANEGKSVPVSDVQSVMITANPVPLKITASVYGKSNIVQSSNNNWMETNVGSHIFYEFSDVSIPVDATIKSVVLFVEHFEEERFSKGKLKWAVGTGWPNKPVVWAVIKAPVYEGESSEAVDAWDITSVVNTAEKINSLQLQIKNNNNVANGKTLVDYTYMVVEYD